MYVVAYSQHYHTLRIEQYESREIALEALADILETQLTLAGTAFENGCVAGEALDLKALPQEDLLGIYNRIRPVFLDSPLESFADMNEACYQTWVRIHDETNHSPSSYKRTQVTMAKKQHAQGETVSAESNGAVQVHKEPVEKTVKHGITYWLKFFYYQKPDISNEDIRSLLGEKGIEGVSDNTLYVWRNDTHQTLEVLKDLGHSTLPEAPPKAPRGRKAAEKPAEAVQEATEVV